MYKFALAGLVTFLLLLSTGGYGHENSTARILLSFSLLAYLWIVFSSVGGVRERIFSLSFGLFSVNLLVLPAMIQCARGYFPFFAKSYPEFLVTKASAVLLFFSLSFIVTYLFQKLPNTDNTFSNSSRFNIDLKKAYIWIFIFITIAVIGFSLQPTVYTIRRADLSLLVFVPTPMAVLTQSLVRYSGFYAFLISLCALIQYKKFDLAVITIFTLSIALLVNNPVNVPRFPLLALMICTLFVVSQTFNRTFKLIFVGSYTLGLLTLFPLLSQISRGDRGGPLLTGFTTYYANSGDFDAFQSLINVIYWIDTEGQQWGRQLLSALLVFVPRSWWQSKAIGTGGVAASFSGYPFNNISAPLQAEFYADFGLAGVILAGVFLGWLVPRLDRSAADAHGHIGQLAALGAGAGFTAILMRGSLIGVIGPSALGILMGLLLTFVSKNYRTRLLS